MAETAVIIVAAGRGLRAGGDMPKQYRPLGNAPVLEHTLLAFLRRDDIDWIQVVIHDDDRDRYQDIHNRLKDGRLLPPVSGGETRAVSVAAGLGALSEYAPRRVLIHDGARPFVSDTVIDGVLAGLADHQAAFPALPVVDALWNSTMTPVNRDGLLRAQTPQGFDFAALKAAYATAPDDAVDDITVARAAGLTITATPGEDANFKITTAEDFARAMPPRSLPDIRTGSGYDVHAFTAGDAVILCGVSIPHDRALKGHSDADVAMHAITDAIYGGLAEGDIGQWFPPSDPQWKGAASDIFLRHAVTRVTARRFAITHIDCTIVCEMPKIGPHARAMRENLSMITGISMDRISIKATTSEQLGFTGRGEGIAATATATLVAQ